MMLEDGDMRMLGVRDGIIGALLAVRWHIRYIDGNYAPRLLPHHKKKRAARDAVLRPLRELEKKLAADLEAVKAAYEKSCEPKPLPDYRHYYMPHKKFPWFCGHCGYAELEPLKHVQKGETVKPSVAA